jgi:hypothetical protein
MEEARWVLNVLYDALAGQVSNWVCVTAKLEQSLACWLGHLFNTNRSKAFPFAESCQYLISAVHMVFLCGNAASCHQQYLCVRWFVRQCTPCGLSGNAPHVLVLVLVCAQDAWLRGATIEGYPHYAVQHKAPGQSVIGSQPVSLDRENLELLRRKRYVLRHAVL